MHPGSKFFKNYFKNKRILVTGNTGFKGSWLCFVLKEMGAKVYGLSIDIPTKPSNFICLKLNNSMKTFYGDVSNFNFFKKIVLIVKPEIIFHLAGQSIVFKSYQNPIETVNTNTNGVLNLMEILRYLKKRINCVIVTSDKCYLAEKKVFFSENDCLGGKDLYSASKASAEIFFKAYCESFFINQKLIKICTARAGNVIGGGDWSQDRIVPDIIKTIYKKKKLVLRNPTSNRPWQHVLEPIFGYLLLAKNLYKKNVNFNSFNIGPSTKKNKTVREISKLLFKKFNYKNSIIVRNKVKFSETSKLNLNTRKINQTIGWKKILNQDLTFEFIVEWYKETVPIKKQLLINITKSQINKFYNRVINAIK